MAKLYSIHDDKAQAFNTPFVAINDGVATRMFKSVANDSATSVCNYPSDFALYYVGEFDEEKGVITPSDIPVFVCSALGVQNVEVGDL